MKPTDLSRWEETVADVPAEGGLPRHIAIIMDGNGRWAAARGLPRVEGHRRGVEALRRTVRAAGEIGVDYLTVYGFSQENWSRPADEIADLMNLLRFFIRRDLSELHRANVRVRVIGARSRLDRDVVAMLDEAESLTRDNAGLTLAVAFNYGGRQEIVEAARRLAEDARAGRIAPAEIDAEMVGRNMFAADLPDPDLVIRTSGERRISNFLLWQSAYAEFVFQDVHWPDYDRADLEGAIAEFRARDRRFGGRAQRLGA